MLMPTSLLMTQTQMVCARVLDRCQIPGSHIGKPQTTLTPLPRRAAHVRARASGRRRWRAAALLPRAPGGGRAAQRAADVAEVIYTGSRERTVSAACATAREGCHSPGTSGAGRRTLGGKATTERRSPLRAWRDGRERTPDCAAGSRDAGVLCVCRRPPASHAESSACGARPRRASGRRRWRAGALLPRGAGRGQSSAQRSAAALRRRESGSSRAQQRPAESRHHSPCTSSACGR